MYNSVYRYLTLVFIINNYQGWITLGIISTQLLVKNKTSTSQLKKKIGYAPFVLLRRKVMLFFVILNFKRMINRLNRQISLGGARSDDIGSRLHLANIIHKADSLLKLFPKFSAMHHLSFVYPYS